MTQYKTYQPIPSTMDRAGKLLFLFLHRMDQVEVAFEQYRMTEALLIMDEVKPVLEEVRDIGFRTGTDDLVIKANDALLHLEQFIERAKEILATIECMRHFHTRTAVH
jgi:hypothetical protein